MTVFFLAVGLEIKRELLVGELSSVRKAALPFIAACGGMLVPVVIYSLLVVSGTPETRGMAIPMATDIAFSLGVLSLLGKRVPLSLKVFLTAFAVVDDIGGILVIALFYSVDVAYGYLIVAAVLYVFLYYMGKFGVTQKIFFLFFGIIIWYLFLQSGIHSTISGVILAFVIPARPRLDAGKYIKRMAAVRQIPGDISVYVAGDKERFGLDACGYELEEYSRCFLVGRYRLYRIFVHRQSFLCGRISGIAESGEVRCACRDGACRGIGICGAEYGAAENHENKVAYFRKICFGKSGFPLPDFTP